MLKPVSMLRVRGYIPVECVDRFLAAVGEQKLIELKDMRGRIGRKLEGKVKPIEPTEKLFRLSALSSRIDSLATSLGISLEAAAEEIEGKTSPEAVDEAEKYVSELEAKVSSIQSRIADLEREAEEEEKALEEKKGLEEELKSIAEESKAKLIEYKRVVESFRVIEEAKTKMARSETVAVFEGWVPEESRRKLEKIAEECTGGKYVLEFARPQLEHGHHAEKPPTLLKNPSIVHVTEALVRSYGIPNYFEIDPSILWFFTFPVIFGMMFGDLGHGLVLTVLASIAYLLKRRGFEGGGEIIRYVLEGSTFFILGGLAATFFGLVYGEVLGHHLHEVFHSEAIEHVREKLLHALGFPSHWSPAEEPMPLLKFSVYVAILHILAGLILGLINKLRMKEYEEAVAGPLVWIWLYLGGVYLFFKHGVGAFMIAFNFKQSFPFLWLPFLVMLVLRMKVLGATEGFGEALDSLLASLSNTISYSRIFAFEMIHVVLSKLFVEFTRGLPMVGPFTIGAIVGTLFFVFFEVIFVFFQDLRLHWVEHGLKFYMGDGVQFKPLMLPVPVSFP
ncbi:MAG: hypothetical protein DRN96_03980 [Thermoproteota archaeon]|nr:MAG: hypothetical protein DRN96_03980 [Candidatus Korarchaeota archaeon]RLG56132.1 MAG: hypothetical protein DRN99_00565 [Candidatus Korarchaeota archaeon]